MIAFKFEDGTKITLPTAWSEVTVKMFSNPYFLSGNPLELLSSVSNIPIEKLANTTEDLTKYFNKVSNFIVKDPHGWKGAPVVPETLHILGVDCKIPDNIEMERFGQKILLGQAMAKTKYVYEAIPEAIAIYLAPKIYPNEWHDKIDKVTAAVRPLSITQVHPIADFFLSNITKSRVGGKIQ